MTYRKIAVIAYFACDGRNSGIDIMFNNRTGMVTIGGWYDSCVGIASETLPLADFLDRLDIRPQDIERSRAGQEG